MAGGRSREEEDSLWENTEPVSYYTSLVFLKSNIMVHRSIVTPVYNEFYTPVPVCRDPVLAMKISIFVKTSLKHSFIPNLAQSRLCEGLGNPSPGLWDEWQEAGVMKRRFLMGEYRTHFLLHKFSLQSNITVHLGIITPVYNEFYTQVHVCRDPVLAMKISIFMKTSLL